MPDTPIITPRLADPASEGIAAALTHAAFDAVLNGRRVSRTELLEATGASAADLDRLAGRALIFDGEDQVVAAHGLSLVPARQHRLELRGRQFWTWCAIDAVGIPAGLGADAVAETTCHRCGTRVTLEFQAGELVHASHPGARIWEAARLEGRGTAGPPHCALMNLFCSAEHLAAWRQAHPDAQGEERDLSQIAALGRTEWAYSQAMLPVTGAHHRPLAHLFDAELRYQEGMAPVCQLDDRGHLAGSGIGRVAGPRLSGTLRWSNFEQVFDDHCQLHIAGMIETDDGAHIRFDSAGFARRVETPPAATWTVAAAVRFMAEDARYRWLEPLPAVWAGEFDERTATAQYRAYAPDLSVDA